MALTDLEMNDAVTSLEDSIGSQHELDPGEILAPVRDILLKVDDDISLCDACIAEGIQCGPHHA